MEKKQSIITGILFVLCCVSVAIAGTVIVRWQADAKELKELKATYKGTKNIPSSSKNALAEWQSEKAEMQDEIERLKKALELEIDNDNAIEYEKMSSEKKSAESASSATNVVKNPEVFVTPGNTEKETPTLTADQIRTMLTSDDRRERGKALAALEKMTDKEEQMKLMQEILATEENYRSKRRVLNLLGTIGGPAASRAIISFLEKDPQNWLAYQASGILAKTADATMMTELYVAYENKNDYLRRGAALAMKRLGDVAPLNQYITRTANGLADVDGSVRQNAVRSLIAIKDPSTIPYLVQALSDQDSRTRRFAIMGLGALQSKEVIPHLEMMLNDANEDVRDSAKRTIEQIRNPKPQEDRRPSRWGSGRGGNR